MPNYDNDEREKKSWREIDSMREKSTHRDAKTAGGSKPGKLERSQAYRSYKSELNKLFEGGPVPEGIKKKLEEAGALGDAPKKKAGLDAILEAESPKALKQALDEYKTAFGFPNQNEDVLAKLIGMSDESVVLEAIKGLSHMLAEGTLKRGKSIKGHLKTVQMTADDPDVQDAAKDLLAKL